MNLFSESRLIFRRATDFVDQTRYNSRTAGQNAQEQEATRVSNTTPANYQTFIDPVTGRDTRMSYNDNGIQTGQVNDGTLSTRQTTGPIGTTPKTAPSVPRVTVAPTPATMQDRVAARRQERIGKLGFAPEQFAQVEDILSKGGTYSGVVNGKPVFQLADGTTIESPVQEGDIQSAIAAAQEDDVAAVQDEDKAATAEIINQQNQTPTETPQAPDPSTAGMGAAFANLPPEAQFLAPFLQQFQQGIQQSMQENTQMAAGNLQDIKETFGGVQDQLDSFAQGYRESSAAIQEILEESKEQTETQLAEEQKAEEQRLFWSELQQNRQVTKAKRDQHESMVAQLALNGGFAQPASLAAVAESDARYDSAISDLAVQFSYARTDLAAKFSSLYVENNNNYTNSTVSNMKDLRSALERIGLQGASNLIARQQAEQTALQGAWDRQNSLRDDLSKTNLNVVGQITDMIIQDKRLKQQDEIASERMLYQEQQADKRFAMQLADDQRQEANTQKKSEQASADDIRSEKNKIMGQPDVQSYVEIKSARDRMSALLSDAINSKDPNKIGSAKVLVQTLTAKASDPTTGVRDGELDKFNRSQTWKDKVSAVGTAISGGDMTGISMDAVKAYVEAIDLMSETQKINALAQMTPVINSIITHNNRSQFFPINPSDILPQEFLTEAGVAYDSYYRSGERNQDTDGYNFEWDVPSSGGGESHFGDELSHLGNFTQEFDTPIASRDKGGLYEPSTVAAWGGVHAGVDIAVPQDSDFTSLIDGEVVEVSPNSGGWGGTIVIRDPNGAEHRISHLSALNPNIKKGSRVNRGELLAKTGGGKGTKGAGNSTGAHVDYRVRYNGKYVDPLTYNPYS